MSEPTIDEMIAWLDGLRPARIREVTAIRAILEQHRSYPDEVEAVVDQFLEDAAGKIQQANLEAIRAFVKRVEKRLPPYDSGKGADAWLRGYRSAVEDELKAMEKETQ